MVERRLLSRSRALSKTLLRPGPLIDVVSLVEGLFDVVADLLPVSLCALLDPARPRLAAAR